MSNIGLAAEDPLSDVSGWSNVPRGGHACALHRRLRDALAVITDHGPDQGDPWYRGTKLHARIAGSARRHAVDDEAIQHAVAHAIRLVEIDNGLFLIGADATGQPLELVARPTPAGELLVFHAMPLRPANATRYLP